MQQNVNNPGIESGDEDFAAMFEASLKERGGDGILKEGEIVKGTVVQITKDYAVVDIGYKSEGQIPISEFTSPKGEVTVKAGDPVEVLLESRENDTGMVVLSKEKADKMRIWDEISAAVKDDQIIKGTITGRVKGGLQVDIGVKAFLPGSQVDIRPVRNLDQFLAKEFEFKVIKFNQKRGNIVLSRRVLLEKQREDAEKERQIKLARQKADEQAKAQQAAREKAEKAKQLQQKQQQEQQEKLDAQKLAKLRADTLKRMMGQMNAPDNATGTGARNAGPSAGYAGRIKARIKPNIVFTDPVPGNPQTEVEVRCAPDGTIIGRRITQPSGVKAWDDAVLRAIDRTQVLPRDTDGSVPSPMILTFRPQDV